MKFYKTLSLFILILVVLINSSLQSKPASAISQSTYTLTKECIDTLKPHLNQLGMSLNDITNKEKAIQFKKNYKNTIYWEKIRSACQLTAVGNCSSCAKICTGNCVCFFTWCFYNCDC